MNYIEVSYLLTGVKSENEAKEKAENISLTLSIGGWGDTPPEKREFLKKYTAKVLDVVFFENKALIKIGFPVILFDHTVPSILTLIYGKLSFTENIKIIDVSFPPAFLDHFQGPKFGKNGIREILNIHHEPLLMSVIKPCVGYSVEEFAEEFYKHALGGADLVKDDEIFFDDGLAPFEKRIEACVKKSEEAEKITGRKTLYIPHLTGRIDSIIEKAKRGINAGAKGFLINVIPYGFDVLQRLSEEIDGFFIAHPSFSGVIFRSDRLGINPTVLFGKLMRLSGADIVIYPSPRKDSPLTGVEAIEIAEILRSDWENINPSFPAITGDINPVNIGDFFKEFGNQTVFNIGGSAYRHPDGVKSGVKAVRDALDCVLSGISFEECTFSSPELKEALKVFKKR